ncbi:hypothetical protein I0D00_03090 [Pseudomonas lalucatii]|uniref:Uncharacterized protein n=1 Tax=Pseudomonas lalucatii TaxID=1424203 RepID=A0ABS5PWR0_9PSED|nr:hypothetical protein [Pseudomonas lalucatii]MBS7660937.1 hypothetical protein [Pseudomonas lalucatii]
MYLAPFFLGQFVVAPLSQTLNVLGRQDLQLIWDFCRLILPSAALIFGASCGWEVERSLGFYSVIMLFLYVINAFLSVSCIRHYDVMRKKLGSGLH